MRNIGTKGVINMDMFNQKLNLYMWMTEKPWLYYGANTDAGLIKSFIDAIENDTPVFISGEDGLRAWNGLGGAYLSAEKCHRLNCPSLSKDPNQQAEFKKGRRLHFLRPFHFHYNPMLEDKNSSDLPYPSAIISTKR